MERIRLAQWSVHVDGKEMAMFTPPGCTAETAMAIAVATFGGDKVTDLVEEGSVKQDLTNTQLSIGDRAYCPECGEYKCHDETCSQDLNDSSTGA